MGGIAFAQTRAVLKSKFKKRGERKLTETPITDDEVEKLWKSDQLASSNPQSMINTLWLMNTIHFGMRTGVPNRNLKWGEGRH